MKDSIFNIRQDIALEMKEKYKLSIEDFILIRKIGDFSLSEKTIEVIQENKVYHWISYDAIQKDFPLLYPTVEAIKKRIHRMTKKGLIVSKAHIVRKDNLIENGFTTPGVYSILRLERETKKLFNPKSEVTPRTECSDPQDKMTQPPGQNGVNKEPLEKNPKKEKVVAEKKDPATAPHETFLKNLKELLIKNNFKNYNSQTLKNLENYSKGDLEEIKKVIEFMKLKNKTISSKVLVAILKDGDHKVIEPVNLKKVSKAEKVAHMLKITTQDEIDDLCNQIAASLKFGKYENLNKAEENIVNIELENILCKRYNKLHRGN